MGIQRIVIVNGTTGSKFFVKHFMQWFVDRKLCATKDEMSQCVFKVAMLYDTVGRWGAVGVARIIAMRILSSNLYLPYDVFAPPLAAVSHVASAHIANAFAFDQRLST